MWNLRTDMFHYCAVKILSLIGEYYISVFRVWDLSQNFSRGQTSSYEKWEGSLWLGGFIPAWTTCSRHNSSRLTGPNILRVQVISILIGGTFWLLVPSEITWLQRYWAQTPLVFIHWCGSLRPVDETLMMVETAVQVKTGLVWSFLKSCCLISSRFPCD